MPPKLPLLLLLPVPPPPLPPPLLLLRLFCTPDEALGWPDRLAFLLEPLSLLLLSPLLAWLLFFVKLLSDLCKFGLHTPTLVLLLELSDLWVGLHTPSLGALLKLSSSLFPCCAGGGCNGGFGFLNTSLSSPCCCCCCCLRC